MRTTLKTIADHVGLSVASVSLVLNNRPNKLSAESRKRIIQAAEKLGYTPQLVSPAMAKKHSRTLGLIVPQVANSFFADLIEGAQQCAQENHCQLLLSTTGESPEKDRESIRLFASRNIAALLLVSSANCSPKVFSGFPFPVIQVDRLSPSLQYSAVVFNHQKGGYLATSHLLQLGHRNIACLTGPKRLANTRRRLEGFYQAYEELGQAPPENAVFEGDYMSDSGYLLADDILQGGFSAIFSANDMMAFGIYKRLREVKKKIPRDLSIVGFDDISFSNLLEVPLTTVRQSGYAIGYEACTRAFLEIEKPDTPKQTIQFEPELIIRSSTAPFSAR